MLPMLPNPWRHPFATGSDVRVAVRHFTDPECLWGYSFEPALRTLEARYGDQLQFTTTLIGLIFSAEEARALGFSPEEHALGALEFRRYGMPITPHVREHVVASAPACLLVKAAALQSEELADALLRLLRFAFQTTDLLVDADEALAAVGERVDGLDVTRALADRRRPDVVAAYQADRTLARTPRSEAVTLRRTANTDGAERYTSGTLVLTDAGGRSAVVPGFQPFAAVEVALVNLEPRLVRLPVPDLRALLAHYPGGLTTEEVAHVLADGSRPPDRPGAEEELTRLVACGGARRVALADDALWTPTQAGG